MIIVTGGAGFIGSNIVQGLNSKGVTDILVVDHLLDGTKIRNLSDLDVLDYVERDDFIDRLERAWPFGKVSAVIHEGACSSTTERDGRFLMRNNFEYSKRLLDWCSRRDISFIYASSASVYGDGRNGFREDRSCERPLNAYAYSKFLFDEHVRRRLPAPRSQIVGLRYFNVYGPREFHKGRMSSTALQFHQQLTATGAVRLFQGSGGFSDGEQRRDFVHVSDCVRANLWFLEHPSASGIFNCGTGRAQTFNDVARAVLQFHGRGSLEYISFPEDLRNSYQSFTQADLHNLRRVGFEATFQSVEQGVASYLEWMAGDRALADVPAGGGRGS